MIEKQIAAAFDKAGCYIIINNGLHPDHQKYFSKMIVCSRTAFNAMLNNGHLFEKETGIKISDGYQYAWKRLKDYHHVMIDIEALAKYVASQDIKAGREQDYIEAEKEMEALTKEEQPKEIENDNDNRTETGIKPIAKKRTRASKNLDA